MFKNKGLGREGPDHRRAAHSIAADDAALPTEPEDDSSDCKTPRTMYQ